MSAQPEAGAESKILVTSVPLLAVDQEEALLAALAAAGPCTIVVVSDLHLGKGIDPKTGRYFRRENFFADDAFRRFLVAQQTAGAAPAMLVLNGDIFDFLRIVDVPRTAGQLADWQAMLARLGVSYSVPVLQKAVSWHEGRFGFQTDDYKSVYKFKIIARGHRSFFRAVADWIMQDGWVLYVKGNHDVEHHWPLIRRALRDEVHLAGASVDAVSLRMCFVEAAVRFDNVYIEHGHQYEWLTRVPDPVELREARGQLSLPPGSFVNRYFINRLERVEPFLDNLKPVSEVLRAIVRRRPVTVVRIAWQGAYLLLRALLKVRGVHILLAAIILAAAIVYMIPLAVLMSGIAFLVLPAFREWVTAQPVSRSLQTLIGLLGLLLPFVVSAIREIWRRWHRPRIGEDWFGEGVYHSVRDQLGDRRVRWRAFWAVLGHTHRQDIQALPDVAWGIGSTLYLNTGTWIPLWLKDRPDLQGRVVLSFVRFERVDGEYVGQSLVWDDDRGVERPPEILAPNEYETDGGLLGGGQSISGSA